jgi:glycosyltransferase involved in cell wall biosynthesis
MVQPLQISIVIPLYNKQGTINRAISSVIAQGIPKIEIIVVNDGSTDYSGEVVKAIIDDRITLIEQSNAGPGRARNVGACKAKADLLVFLDGDDEWRPSFLMAGLAALERHPEAVAYACSYDSGAFAHLVRDKVSLLTSYPALLPPPSAEVDPSRIKIALNGLHSSSTIVRQSAFRRAGGFYDRNRCLWGEDSYLWAQILFMGPVYWDPTPRVLFHVEDSALGFAVKFRDRERPLTTHWLEVIKDIAPEHRAAFFRLVQSTASDDAATLAESGRIIRCLGLRRKFSLLKPRTLLGDARRYLRYVRRLVIRNQ